MVNHIAANIIVTDRNREMLRLVEPENPWDQRTALCRQFPRAPSPKGIIFPAGAHESPRCRPFAASDGRRRQMAQHHQTT